MKKVTIPKGSMLYRASDNACSYTSNICNQKRECSNTGKHGVYFSTYILQSLAMALEYGRDLELGIFRTKAPLTVYVGKYSFRNIHPEIWDPFPVGHVIQENENISHFDSEMEPIINSINNMNYSFNLKAGMGELFLTKKEELDSIELVETYKINKDILESFIKAVYSTERSVPLDDMATYIRSGSIKQFYCPAKGGGKRKTRKTHKRTKRLSRVKQ